MKTADLVVKWKRRAKTLFLCAGRTKNRADKRRMEFGAMVNLNCALELDDWIRSQRAQARQLLPPE